MQRKQFIILIILLVIGFSSVSATLILNGDIGVGVKLDDFDVIFVEALLDGKEDTKATISEDKKTITFSTDKLFNLGDSTRLDYKVKNTSTQYNADVTINCTNEANEYVTIESSFDGNTIPLISPINMKAQEVKSGYINVELAKAYAGEDTSIEISCKIEFTATSRENYVYSLSFDSNGGSKVEDKSVDLNDSYGELPIPVREDYVFLGWYDEEDNKVDSSTILDSNGSKTLYAKWTPVCPYEVGKVWNFNYTGGEQTFNTPCLGNYKIEVWGAQGGAATSTYIGGYGGYSVGNINLTYEEPVFINVGGMGGSVNVEGSSVGANGGYNGGGSSTNNLAASYHLYGAGGGATHIALKSGVLSTLSNDIDKILIVAGGGGGGRWQKNVDNPAALFGYGGHGGGYIGGYGTLRTNATAVPGGSQTNGAAFGKGGNGNAQASGGGGFYGGYGTGTGGGGSGYIGNPLLYDKVMYCYNCSASNEEATKTISTGSVNSSPISNYAKTGHGYARITLVSFPY